MENGNADQVEVDTEVDNEDSESNEIKVSRISVYVNHPNNRFLLF